MSCNGKAVDRIEGANVCGVVYFFCVWKPHFSSYNMYLRLEKQVVELGELMHMAKAPELDRFLAIKLLINSISHDKAKSYVVLVLVN